MILPHSRFSWLQFCPSQAIHGLVLCSRWHLKGKCSRRQLYHLGFQSGFGILNKFVRRSMIDVELGQAVCFRRRNIPNRVSQGIELFIYGYIDSTVNLTKLAVQISCWDIDKALKWKQLNANSANFELATIISESGIEQSTQYDNFFFQNPYSQNWDTKDHLPSITWWRSLLKGQARFKDDAEWIIFED